MWSTWWKELIGIGRGVGLGSWFDDNMVRVVGQTPLFFLERSVVDKVAFFLLDIDVFFI
jgi:hypothetical protein